MAIRQLAPTRSEARDMCGMMSLNACRAWDYLNPSDNTPYRAAAALMSENVALDGHIAAVEDLRIRIDTAWIAVGRPERGMIAACRHALDVILVSLKDEPDVLANAQRAFKLSQAALRDIT